MSKGKFSQFSSVLLSAAAASIMCKVRNWVRALSGRLYSQSQVHAVFTTLQRCQEQLWGLGRRRDSLGPAQGPAWSEPRVPTGDGVALVWEQGLPHEVWGLQGLLWCCTPVPCVARENSSPRVFPAKWELRQGLKRAKGKAPV